MSSSTLLVVRTAVMLGCLIAVPLIALLGNFSWAELFQAARNQKLPELPQASTAADDSWSAAPPAGLPSPVPPRDSAPSASLPHTGAPPASASHQAAPQPPAGANQLSAGSLGIAAPQPPDPASRTAGIAPPFWAPDSARQPAVTRLPPTVAPRTSPPPIDAGAAQASYVEPAAGAAASQAPTDWLDRVQLRLKELGAVHYRLESWGADGELYRFRAKMGLDSNPNYVRHFEAIDPDPAQAMHHVLQQVEAWRGGLSRGQ